MRAADGCEGIVKTADGGVKESHMHQAENQADILPRAEGIMFKEPLFEEGSPQTSRDRLAGFMNSAKFVWLHLCVDVVGRTAARQLKSLSKLQTARHRFSRHTFSLVNFFKK